MVPTPEKVAAIQAKVDHDTAVDELTRLFSTYNNFVEGRVDPTKLKTNMKDDIAAIKRAYASVIEKVENNPEYSLLYRVILIDMLDDYMERDIEIRRGKTFVPADPVGSQKTIS
jgi:phage host-nuclease inhibitor protein Gam